MHNALIAGTPKSTKDKPKVTTMEFFRNGSSPRLSPGSFEYWGTGLPVGPPSGRMKEAKKKNCKRNLGLAGESPGPKSASLTLLRLVLAFEVAGLDTAGMTVPQAKPYSENTPPQQRQQYNGSSPLPVRRLEFGIPILPNHIRVEGEDKPLSTQQLLHVRDGRPFLMRMDVVLACRIIQVHNTSSRVASTFFTRRSTSKTSDEEK
ncbi:hypothetical protein B0H14DRAFT_2656970 [Mycena olivaceomarginata]|nr:hypothetical protein B0H14DRAFT_2656970 [Mycena olivaceomarginata]